MYKILGGDGKEYGPVSADQLRQWVREGRANALTQVRVEGATQWQALSSIAELADVFSAGAGAPPTIGALPAGGTAAAPGAVHDGDYELDIMGCISRAWAVLSANFWLMVGGCAIYLLIIGGISGFAQIPFIGPLFSILNLIITGPLIGGVYFFLLRVQRGQRAEVGDVFNGFRDNLGQLILAYLIPALIMGAIAIPGAITMAVPIVVMVKNEAASAGLIVVAAAGFLVLFIPLVYFSLCWVFTIPLVVDRRLDFWSAMKASRRQVGRHWWTLLGFTIVIGLINFAGLLACCVGMFVTMPLVFTAMLFAYETLFTPRTAQPGPGA